MIKQKGVNDSQGINFWIVPHPVAGFCRNTWDACVRSGGSRYVFGRGSEWLCPSSSGSCWAYAIQSMSSCCLLLRWYGNSIVHSFSSIYIYKPYEIVKLCWYLYPHQISWHMNFLMCWDLCPFELWPRQNFKTCWDLYPRKISWHMNF